MKLTAEETDALQTLGDALDRAIKSPRIRDVLSRLYGKGMIDAVAAYAQLTDSGRAALAEHKEGK